VVGLSSNFWGACACTLRNQPTAVVVVDNYTAELHADFDEAFQTPSNHRDSLNMPVSERELPTRQRIRNGRYSGHAPI
jgi:hypothetical protein